MEKDDAQLALRLQRASRYALKDLFLIQRAGPEVIDERRRKARRRLAAPGRLREQAVAEFGKLEMPQLPPLPPLPTLPPILGEGRPKAADWIASRKRAAASFISSARPRRQAVGSKQA